MNNRLIAEYKRKSPFEGEVNLDPIEVAIPKLLRLNPLGLSIIVDDLWGGSYEDLAKARTIAGPDIPILAKALQIDAEKAQSLGATVVLTYVGPHEDVPSLVEVHDERQLELALRLGARGIVANNRDLRDGSLGEVAEQLAPKIPDNVLFIAASGYQTDSEGPTRADGVIIGTALA